MMMKYLHKFIFLICACALGACADLSDLENDVEDVRQEISELGKECEAINSRIESLKQLVAQIQAREEITGVSEIKDVDDEVIGYIITFKNAETITLYLPVIPDTPSGPVPPVISVIEDEEGIWWIMNGEYILDAQGAKVPVGRDAVSPVLKVEGDCWYVSLDDGRTWEEMSVGSAPGYQGTGVESVKDGTDEVEFVLTDGTVFKIPKSKTATLDISYNRNVVSGSRISIYYKYSSSTGIADITCFGNRNVGNVSVSHRSQYSDGYIYVDISPDYDVSMQKVYVYMDYGEGTLVRTLEFTEYGYFDIDPVAPIPASGGEISLNVNSTGYPYVYSEIVQGGDWLSQEGNIYTAKANSSHQARVGAVNFEPRTSALGKANFTKTVYIIQLGTGSVPCYEEYAGLWKLSGSDQSMEVRLDYGREGGYLVSGLASGTLPAIYNTSSGYLEIPSLSYIFRLSSDKNSLTDTRTGAVYQRQGVASYFEDGEILRLNSASSGYTPLNLVILGDGYQQKDLRHGGKFERSARSAMDAFFSVEPLKSFKDRFNVYVVAYESVDEGVDIESQGLKVNTYFDTYWNGNSTAMWVYDSGRDKVIDVVKKTLGLSSDAEYYRTVALVLVNTDVVAGSCGYPYRDIYSNTGVLGEPYASFAIAVLPANNSMGTRGLVRHELGGHAFGRLGDEYESKSYGNDLADWHAKGFYRNVTTDRNSWNWDSFIGRSGYTDVTYVSRNNYWCASQGGIMYNNNGEFNAPSRQIIYERIVRQTEGAGNYSFDRFLEYDKRNL